MSSLINLLYLFSTSFILSIILTPWMIKLACRFKVLDYPAKRKIHTKPIPRLGGVGLYLAFFVTLLFGCMVFSGFNDEFRREIYGLLIGSSVILIFGLWDDLHGLYPLIKIFVQVLAGIVLFSFGYRIELITNPLGGIFHLPLILSFLFTIAWIVMLTNAINLIDGMDGLAAGLTVIIGGILCLTGLFLHTDKSVLLLVPLVGASLGFLRYNFYPAKIFMGDSGSCFLGFVLAAASLVGYPHKIATAVALLIPITALWVPIYDTLLAIMRRIMGKTPVFVADKKHLHHRLLAMGLTQKQAVLLMYVICIYFCIIAFLFILIPAEYAFVLLILLSIGVFLGARTLGFIERRFRLVYAKGFRKGRQRL